MIVVLSTKMKSKLQPFRGLKSTADHIMYRHLLILVAFFVLFSACDSITQNQPSTTEGAFPAVVPSTCLERKGESVVFPETSGAPESFSTTLDYVQDMDIPQGDPAEIVDELGVFSDDEYSSFVTEPGWLLGADRDKNLLFLSNNSYTLKLIRKNGSQQVLFQNLLKNRQHIINSVSWDGGDFVVWSESQIPEVDTIGDGADWAIYLLNIQTGETVLIEKDCGLRAAEGSAYYYLSPTKIAISDGYVSYISFSERADGKVVQAISLYEIQSKQLQVIYYLQGDPAENGMGYPSIGGGSVVWSQAYIRPEDMLYEGYTLLYDLISGETKKLYTPENVINACATTNWLVGVNHPNQTFYDSQIVAYQVKENTWKYKISAKYPGYAESSVLGHNLNFPSAWKQFVTWTGDVMTNVLLLDLEGGKRYTIVEDAYDITGINLFPGGLLIWMERHLDINGNLKGEYHYCFLRAS